jgi:hypothetical protein
MPYRETRYPELRVTSGNQGYLRVDLGLSKGKPKGKTRIEKTRLG